MAATGLAGMTVGDLTGTSVVAVNGDRIGEVDAVIETPEGGKAIVGVGGFLGIGERDVALALSDLTYSTEADQLNIDLDREALEQMPEAPEDAERLPDDTQLSTLMAAGAQGTSGTGDAASGDAMTDGDDAAAGGTASDDADADADTADGTTTGAATDDAGGMTDGADDGAAETGTGDGMATGEGAETAGEDDRAIDEMEAEDGAAAGDADGDFDVGAEEEDVDPALADTPRLLDDDENEETQSQ
jgi:hypothetical protein